MEVEDRQEYPRDSDLTKVKARRRRRKGGIDLLSMMERFGGHG